MVDFVRKNANTPSLAFRAIPLEAAPKAGLTAVNPIVLGFWGFVVAPAFAGDIARRISPAEEQAAFDYGGFNPKPKLFAAFQFPNV